MSYVFMFGDINIFLHDNGMVALYTYAMCKSNKIEVQ